MEKIRNDWWKGNNFFGKRYYEPDNSKEGYLPSTKETLEGRTTREVEGVIRLLDLQGDESILDLPCGYGRHTIELAKQGYTTLGLDINVDHLSKALQDSRHIFKSNYQKAHPHFNFGDMKEIGEQYYSKFDAVINMFYSFGFFENEDENVQTMQNFYNTLKGDGQLLLHTDVSPEMIKNGTTQTNAVRELDDGNRLIILERYNENNSRMEGSWETTDAVGNIIHPRAFYSVRIYTADEFTNMAKHCGFRQVDIYGSFQGESFGPDSQEMIMVAKK